MTEQVINEKVDLSGQVALVTGGGRGLGRALAQALAAAGASVAVIARSEDQLSETVRLIEQAGGRAIALPADVSDQRAVEQVVAAIEQRLGPVDLLVNNAAVVGPANGPIWEIDPVQWWRAIEINLRGPFLCARAVLPSMVARRRGRIVNTTSIAVQTPFNTAYHASKAALTHLTNCLAAETKEYGISVFAYMPGGIRTTLTEYLAESPDVHESLRNRFQAYFREGWMSDTPERAVQGVMFLASGKADALSGRYISAWDDEAESLRRVDEIQRDDLLTLRIRPLHVPDGGLQNRHESLVRSVHKG